MPPLTNPTYTGAGYIGNPPSHEQENPSLGQTIDRKAKLISADVMLIDYVHSLEQEAHLLRSYVLWKQNSGKYQDLSISDHKELD